MTGGRTTRRATTGRRRALVLTGVVAVVGVLLGAWTLSRGAPAERAEAVAAAPAVPTAAPTTSSPSQAAVVDLPPGCDRRIRAFVPERITTAGVDTAPVAALPRDAQGLSPVPPDLDPHLWAWDETTAAPGSRAGIGVYTVHTYPAGSRALGNQLMAHLRPGSVIAVHGTSATACYRVSRLWQVNLRDAPGVQAALDTIYRADGPSAIAGIWCSGTRLGPDDWTARTLFVATRLG